MIPKAKYSLSDAKLKIASFCAYQERSHQEVELKLKSWHIHPEHVHQLIAYLIEYNFLNESRFATLYARSKFNQKSWGWNKIKQGLNAKGISGYCLDEAHKEIIEEEYLERLKVLMLKKESSLKGSALVKKKKVFSFLAQKGYELTYIYKVYKETHD